MSPSPRHGAFLVLRAGLRSFGVRPATALLVLGHMRCGSTLLTHLLLTHRDLIGYGERNSPYRDANDFDRLEIMSRLYRRALIRRVRYAVDQVNHDHLTPDPALLADSRVRCIFLIREPEASIRSILDLTRRFYDPWSTARAAGYYIARLDSLARLAGIIGRHRYLAATYQDLVHGTQPTFRRLESFLGLDSPLREDYVLQKFSGTRGDPTEKIRSGRINRDDVAIGDAELPEGELERARAAYQAGAKALGIPA